MYWKENKQKCPFSFQTEGSYFVFKRGNDMTTQNASQANTQSRWQFDPFHTQVEFAAKHLGMMTVRGHFTEISATGHIDPDHPEASSVEVTMQAASLRTHNEKRDNDLQSSNFLEIDKYPTITIKSNTRPVTLSVVRYGEFNDPMMGHRIGYSAEGQISRKDFGMTFNMMLDGKWIVSDEVQIMIEGEFVEQKQEQPAG